MIHVIIFGIVVIVGAIAMLVVVIKAAKEL